MEEGRDAAGRFDAGNPGRPKVPRAGVPLSCARLTTWLPTTLRTSFVSSLTLRRPVTCVLQKSCCAVSGQNPKAE